MDKPDRRKTKAVTRALLTWFEVHARDLPWRRTRDPYAVWVSEIMLQQTQVKTVIPYWGRWMTALPDIHAVARAKPERIHKLWEGLGYYTRVRNLQKAAQVIVEKHNCQFPTSFEEVLELPGIGRYTAGAICSIAFNQPQPIVDGNVIRVLSRVFGIEGEPRERATQERFWNVATALVRTAAASDLEMRSRGACAMLNQGLMELGATVCVPRAPNCRGCPLFGLCLARRERRIDELPNIAARAAVTKRRFLGFLVEQDSAILLRQRPAGVVNAHLWELPNVEANGQKVNLQKTAAELFGDGAEILETVCSIKHSITRYRMTLDVFRVKAPEQRARTSSQGSWVKRKTLTRLAFCAAHLKALKRAQMWRPS